MRQIHKVGQAVRVDELISFFQLPDGALYFNSDSKSNSLSGCGGCGDLAPKFPIVLPSQNDAMIKLEL